MSVRLHIHPDTPQKRFVERAGKTLADDGVVVMLTGESYSLTARPGSKQALERIAQIKQINSDKKLFSLVVPDLSDVATYAVVSNHNYRILKRFLPGPYTFVLPATREVPRMLQTKRKTIGLRVPEHEVPRRVARAAGGALLATTLRLPDEEYALSDPDEIEQKLLKRVDLFLDSGWGGLDSSTLIDLVDDVPELLRVGAGDPEPFRT